MDIGKYNDEWICACHVYEKMINAEDMCRWMDWTRKAKKNY